ncbi:TetR/AcrR family transcriptional regulator [uncultured Microbacterium sp.]|uniref:TetR/AcrR family transcriptional regulator n=1 Tax=uncultured Microbacterium sp. TaxID=191216 RepID=UPI0035CA7510
MTQHRAGPVRSEEARTAILTATGRLMSDRGYEGLTMEGVAQEAGVGKQTIYRWWSSKSALVAECLLEGFILPDHFAVPETGDLRADLTAWLDSLFQLLAEPRGDAILRALIAAAADDAEVGRRLRERLGGGSVIEDRLRRGIDEDDLRPDAPLTEITEALVGAVIIRALSREAVAPGASDRLVRAVIESSEPT